MRSIQLKIVEKIKIHVLCQVTFFGNHAVYEIMLKNMVEPEATDDNITWHMHFACQITKATGTY
jgi:hypothetical protein